MADRKALLCLLICFPYGLFLMWKTTRWRPVLKVAVTACFVALTTAVFLPQTAPPARGQGGVELVGAEKTVEVYGPEMPASLDANYVGYGVTASGNGPVLSDVKENTTDIYVYANDNGSYYHTSDCKYVAWYSRKYPLAVAYYSGYSPCPLCGAAAYSPGQV